MTKLVGSPRKSLITSMVRIAALAFGWTAVSAGPAVANEPLVLEAKIPIGNVSGRIDHMAIDLGRNDCLSLSQQRRYSRPKRSQGHAQNSRTERTPGCRLRSGDRYALCGQRG